MKIIFYLASANISLPDREHHKLSIDVKKMCEFCNIKKETLKKNIEKMQKTVITFASIEDGEDGFKIIEENISLIPYSKFDYNNTLKIELYDKVAKLITSVVKPFAIVNAENMMKLSHKHSIKMIQILERINNFSNNVAKRKHYTLEELNGFFGTNYATLKSIKLNVLDKVKEELDRASILSFEATIVKDKLDNKAGRPKAVSITIDLINNDPTLF